MDIRHFFLTAACLTFLLTGCGGLTLTPSADFEVEIQPSQISYEVAIAEEENPDTGEVSLSYNLTVNEVQLVGFTRYGSIGATVTGYSIEYFYANGSQIPTDFGEPLRGSLAFRLSAGEACVDTDAGCVDFPGAVPEEGPVSSSSSFAPLDPDLGYEIFFSDVPEDGAYAVITLSGVDDNGVSFERELDPVTIVQYVVAGPG